MILNVVIIVLIFNNLHCLNGEHDLPWSCSIHACLFMCLMPFILHFHPFKSIQALLLKVVSYKPRHICFNISVFTHFGLPHPCAMLTKRFERTYESILLIFNAERWKGGFLVAMIEI